MNKSKYIQTYTHTIEKLKKESFLAVIIKGSIEINLITKNLHKLMAGRSRNSKGVVQTDEEDQKLRTLERVEKNREDLHIKFKI